MAAEWTRRAALVGGLGAGAALVAPSRADALTDEIVLTESLRAQAVVSGGGEISLSEVDGSDRVYVHWSDRLMVDAAGRGDNFADDGWFELDCPSSATVTGVGGASSQSATSEGIPLLPAVALYWIMPLGAGPDDPSALRLVGNSSDFDVPHDWLRLAYRNPDSDVIRLANGLLMHPGQTWSDGDGMLGTSTGLADLADVELPGSVSAGSFLEYGGESWSSRAGLGWINIRDYGAVGDGVADDYAALLACVFEEFDPPSNVVPRFDCASAS